MNRLAIITYILVLNTIREKYIKIYNWLRIYIYVWHRKKNYYIREIRWRINAMCDENHRSIIRVIKIIHIIVK